MRKKDIPKEIDVSTSLIVELKVKKAINRTERTIS